MIKKFKGARFKVFSNYDDALHFSKNGPSVLLNVTNNETCSAATFVEKPSPFRGPKYQDMIKFRKSIEKGDEDFFEKVWNFLNLNK